MPARARAQVVELEDTRGLGPRAERRGGSTPLLGTGFGRLTKKDGPSRIKSC